MPNKTVQLTPEQEDALGEMASRGVIDPIEGLRALNLAPGKGEFADLQPPGPLDSLANRFGFETSTTRRNRELLSRQQLALPMIQELMKERMTAPTAGEASTAFPGFPLTPEYYKPAPTIQAQRALLPGTFDIDELMPKRESIGSVSSTVPVQGPGVPVAKDILEADPFVQDVLAGKIHPEYSWDHGLVKNTPDQRISQEARERGPGMYKEGPYPAITVNTPVVPSSPGQEMVDYQVGEPTLKENKRLSPGLTDIYKNLSDSIKTASRGEHRAPTPADLKMKFVEAKKAAMQAEGKPITPADEVEFWREAIGLDVAEAKRDLYKAKGDTEKVRGSSVLPAQAYALNALGDLRHDQQGLVEAQRDWYKERPKLQRELAGMPAFELDAVKRVHKAIQDKTPIDPGDWLIVERWSRKASPRFGLDFMGRMYDRYSGEKAQAGQPFGQPGLPTPPSTDEVPELKEVEATKEDLFHRFGAFLGSLLDAAKGGQEELPTPKTPEEAAKLKPGTRYRTPDGREMVR